MGSIHSSDAGGPGRDDVRRVAEVVEGIMDVNLFLSLWINRNEGRESWLNWLRFQTAEPAANEQERGEYLADWFDELEVG